LEFRVTDFRSVADSGWIHTDQVVASIGINGADKTNLLLLPRKHNPATNDGAINLVADVPLK